MNVDRAEYVQNGCVFPVERLQKRVTAFLWK